MQHDHVLKKLNFVLLIPSPRVKGEGGCRQRICYHVAAIVIPLNLICNMSVMKRLNFDLTPRVRGWGDGGWGYADKIFATMLMHVPFPLI